VKVAFVVYPDFTALDLVGPYEVISRWPNAEVHFVASSPEPVRTSQQVRAFPALGHPSDRSRRGDVGQSRSQPAVAPRCRTSWTIGSGALGGDPASNGGCGSYQLR
jgi:putative intracellular protease/amidase